MSDWVRPGTRVSVIEPNHGRSVYRARALNTELAGYQLARVEGEELKLLLTQEGVRWARGWSTKAADALLVASVL